ncbi:MAG: helix-hairpin-helix domain-containing protein [Myxococcales bacterium]|nr:helix-hairpin-helix domain-containing protein [Myxococcales bacterium]
MVKKSSFVLSFALVALATAQALAATAERVGPVPSGPVVAAAQTAAAETPAVSGVVNINTATAQQLQLLPGVGPSRAQAIIAQRERHPYRRPEDLLSIRGIGRATLNRMLPYVVVEGETTLTRPVPPAARRPRPAP